MVLGLRASETRGASSSLRLTTGFVFTQAPPLIKTRSQRRARLLQSRNIVLVSSSHLHARPADRDEIVVIYLNRWASSSRTCDLVNLVFEIAANWFDRACLCSSSSRRLRCLLLFAYCDLDDGHREFIISSSSSLQYVLVDFIFSSRKKQMEAEQWSTRANNWCTLS